MRLSAYSWNVKLGILWTVAETASMAIRSGDVLDAYIYLLTNNNTYVGFVQGVNGVMQLVIAFPAGWLSDHTRRDTVLKFAALLGAIAGASLLAAVLLKLSVAYIFASAALLGLYRGFNNPALESIYADSVPTGCSALYTAKHVAQSLAFSIGPALSLILFTLLGNEWKVSECRIVLLTGLGLLLPPLIMMCFFDDDLTLDKASEALRSNVKPIPSDISLAEAAEKQPARCGCSCTSYNLRVVVPVLITFSDFCGALASGMTLKFFSLFFMQQCKLQPVAVSMLGVSTPFAVTAASIVAQRTSLWAGRVQVTLVTRLADVVLLCLMAFTDTAARAWLVVIHITRMALANSTRPLLRSLLMDYVPKRHRGKVNALDSVRTLSWSGSAALGGLLIHAYGFQTTFLITASVKLVSWLPLALLPFLVDDGMCSRSWRLARSNADGASSMQSDDGTLRDPLLVTIDAEDRHEGQSQQVKNDDHHHPPSHQKVEHGWARPPSRTHD